MEVIPKYKNEKEERDHTEERRTREQAHKEITRQRDLDVRQGWCPEYCADTIQQVDPGMLIFLTRKNH